MSKRIPAEMYSKQSRKLLFDANVMISIFWTIPSRYNQAELYSNLFARAIKFGQEICVDSIVLSETINRVARIEYDRYLFRNSKTRDELSFKEFRGTSEGSETYKHIQSILTRSIYPKFSIVGKMFSKSDLDCIDLCGHDFNDILIEAVCKENDCILVTHDGDFNDSEIDIITGNAKLLTKAPTPQVSTD